MIHTAATATVIALTVGAAFVWGAVVGVAWCILESGKGCDER